MIGSLRTVLVVRRAIATPPPLRSQVFLRISSKAILGCWSFRNPHPKNCSTKSTDSNLWNQRWWVNVIWCHICCQRISLFTPLNCQLVGRAKGWSLFS